MSPIKRYSDRHPQFLNALFVVMIALLVGLGYTIYTQRHIAHNQVQLSQQGRTLQSNQDRLDHQGLTLAHIVAQLNASAIKRQHETDAIVGALCGAAKGDFNNAKVARSHKFKEQQIRNGNNLIKFAHKFNPSSNHQCQVSPRPIP